MNGYEIIQAIKIGVYVMQFAVLPLCVLTAGIFTYGLVTLKK
jgi:hypothetical protein